MAQIDTENWPKAPREATPLPHDGLDKEDVLALRSKGWDPVDVRGLPVTDMAERADAVLMWLHGVRLGTISADTRKARFVEVEARACGIMQGKRVDDRSDPLSGDNLDAVLDIGEKVQA